MSINYTHKGRETVAQANARRMHELAVTIWLYTHSDNGCVWVTGGRSAQGGVVLVAGQSITLKAA